MSASDQLYTHVQASVYAFQCPTGKRDDNNRHALATYVVIPQLLVSGAEGLT